MNYIKTPILIVLFFVIMFTNCSKKEGKPPTLKQDIPTRSNNSSENKEADLIKGCEYRHSFGILDVKELYQYDEVLQIRIFASYGNDIVATLFKKSEDISIDVKILPTNYLSVPAIMEQEVVDFRDIKRMITVEEWNDISWKMTNIEPRLNNFSEIGRDDLIHFYWGIYTLKDKRCEFYSSSQLDKELMELFEAILQLVKYESPTLRELKSKIKR